MKFKKVKSSDVSTGAVQIAGAGVGFMATNGIANAYAKVDDEALMTDEQKKKKLTVAIAAIVVGAGLSIALDGNDSLTQGVKALGVGLAGGGIKGVVSHIAKENPPATTAGTTTARFVSGALGCPCETASPYASLNRASLRRPALRNAVPAYAPYVPSPRTSSQVEGKGDVFKAFNLS